MLPLGDLELSGLQVIITVLNHFAVLDQEMPIQQLRVYVEVALRDPEPTPMSELSIAVGIAQSSASRNVAALSNWNRHHNKGHDLLRAYEDPMNRRRKLVELTPKGRALKARLEKLNGHSR